MEEAVELLGLGPWFMIFALGWYNDICWDRGSGTGPLSIRRPICGRCLYCVTLPCVYATLCGSQTGWFFQPPPLERTRYDFPTKTILLTRDPKDRSIKGKHPTLLILRWEMLLHLPCFQHGRGWIKRYIQTFNKPCSLVWNHLISSLQNDYGFEAKMWERSPTTFSRCPVNAHSW